jgi:hypothetical protein
VPVSTGTNNVFPEMVEGTLAGLAAGVVALNVPGVRAHAIRLARRLEIMRDGQVIDIALVDVVAYDELFLASRAIWEIDKIRSVILSQVKPATLGASAIGGYLAEQPPHHRPGIWLEIGPGREQVMVPIAPGVIAPVTIASRHWLAVGEQHPILHTPCVLALDGEREVPVRAGEQVEVRLSQDGPHVVNVQAALQAASQTGFFVSLNGFMRSERG